MHHGALCGLWLINMYIGYVMLAHFAESPPPWAIMAGPINTYTHKLWGKSEEDTVRNHVKTLVHAGSPVPIECFFAQAFQQVYFCLFSFSISLLCLQLHLHQPVQLYFFPFPFPFSISLLCSFITMCAAKLEILYSPVLYMKWTFCTFKVWLL